MEGMEAPPPLSTSTSGGVFGMWEVELGLPVRFLHTSVHPHLSQLPHGFLDFLKTKFALNFAPKCWTLVGQEQLKKKDLVSFRARNVQPMVHPPTHPHTHTLHLRPKRRFFKRNNLLFFLCGGGRRGEDPTTNGGLQKWKLSQNGTLVHIAQAFSHVLAPIRMLSRCLVTKFLHRSSGGSFLRVGSCWRVVGWEVIYVAS